MKEKSNYPYHGGECNRVEQETDQYTLRKD